MAIALRNVLAQSEHTVRQSDQPPSDLVVEQRRESTAGAAR